MLSMCALSEAAVSALPDNQLLAFAAQGTIAGSLDIAARLRVVADFGTRPVYAVEITLHSTGVP